MAAAGAAAAGEPGQRRPLSAALAAPGGPALGWRNCAPELETFPAGNPRRPAPLRASVRPGQVPLRGRRGEEWGPARRIGRWGEWKGMWESF